MKNVILRIPCIRCEDKVEIKTTDSAISKWRKGKSLKEAFPKMSSADIGMLKSQICGDCRRKRTKENPHGMIDFNSDIMSDAIRASEHRFHKPLGYFNKREFDYLWMLYNRAADPRISLKIYPETNNPRVYRKRDKEQKDCERRALRAYSEALDACRGVQKEMVENPRAKFPSAVKTRHEKQLWMAAEASYEHQMHKRAGLGKPKIKEKWAYIMATFQDMKQRHKKKLRRR